jgi:cytochrome b
MKDDYSRIRIKIWDIPTRATHWLIVVTLGTLWWTAKHDAMQWHIRAGYFLFALLLFRLYWGIVGSSTARFTEFVRGPRVVLSYARVLFKTSESNALGHNPIGGWSIVILLTLMSAEIVLGLFAVDIDGIDSGPLSHRVSFDAGRYFARMHGFFFDVLLGFVAIHIAAVLFYLFFKKTNLTATMVTGRRTITRKDEIPSDPMFASPTLAVIGIIFATLVTWLITSL